MSAVTDQSFLTGGGRTSFWATEPDGRSRYRRTARSVHLPLAGAVVLDPGTEKKYGSTPPDLSLGGLLCNTCDS